MSKTTEKKNERKNVNTVSIVGTLAEVGNLKVFRVDNDGNEVEDNVKADDRVIKAVEFKKPAFVIDVNGQKIGVKTYPASENKKPDKFKAMQTIMEYEVGTRVKVNGTITVGDPYPAKSGNIFESVDVTMYSLSTSNVPKEDYAIGEVTGYVKSAKAETKMVDDEEEETGRALINFYAYNEYNDDKSLKPFTIIADKESAEDVIDYFEDGGNASFQFKIVSTHVGGKVKNTKGGLGKKSDKLINGYDKTEYIFTWGTLFDDDDDEYGKYFIEEDVVKKLLKAHTQKVEEAKNGKKSDNEKPKKGLGSARKAHFEEPDDDDENPFDE